MTTERMEPTDDEMDDDLIDGCRWGDSDWNDDDVCERCDGDGMDPMSDWLLPCPLCQPGHYAGTDPKEPA